MGRLSLVMIGKDSRVKTDRASRVSFPGVGRIDHGLNRRDFRLRFAFGDHTLRCFAKSSHSADSIIVTPSRLGKECASPSNQKGYVSLFLVSERLFRVLQGGRRG